MKLDTSSSPVLISACLMGEACRFDGQGKHNSELLELLKDITLIPVCPEVEGGLPIPRPPAEIKGRGVFRKNGEDVSEAFQKGASRCTESSVAAHVSQAILKSRSPACGCGKIYDGSFSKTLIDGDGIFTQHLKSAGIECSSDEEFLSNNS
ncbi:MAG: DUF523 domain-containing protein [Candidatus Marinimicrobia bacterium]|nr:DUF523 domain-containing protein [Candidatus Neomarinimicrobiota bacterium]